MCVKLLVVLIVIIDFAFSAVIPVVNIQDGQVGGREYVTDNNKTYYGFQGIPYASPPIGPLRFEPPTPPKPWSGIWDGIEDSKSCISTNYLFHQSDESEDCLYINVYTPYLQPQSLERLPVMFWIYGGDFVSGNSLKTFYGPDFLMEEDVILVTFNYRLGPLGFLSTGDEVIPGNNGLKDQYLALKWTHDNIASFGGDPNKITIFGQSAGGVSIALHLLSKKSKGLFRAAIVESGSALVPWALDLNPKAYALQFADRAGYHGNNSQELKVFLKARSTMEIFIATSYIKLDWPVLEVPNQDAFLTESNYALLQLGDFNQVPTIIGICSEESLAFLIDQLIAKAEALVFDLNPAMLIPSDLNPTTNDTSLVTKKIRDLYISENETFHVNIAGYAKYLTDNMFARGIIKHAQLQSSFSPVYFYQFAYHGRTLLPAFIDGAERVGHAGEIPFLFKIALLHDSNPNNLIAQNRLVKLWTNFAKYMEPTPDQDILLNNITWPSITPGKLQFLNFNDTLEIKSNLKEKEYSEWENIFEEYGAKPFVLY